MPLPLIYTRYSQTSHQEVAASAAKPATAAAPGTGGDIVVGVQHERARAIQGPAAAPVPAVRPAARSTVLIQYVVQYE